MNKAVKIIGIGFAILVAIVFISMVFSGEAQESFQQGMDSAKETVEGGQQ